MYFFKGKEEGITTLMVVAFMGIFLLIMGMITSYAFEESKYGRALYGREQALHVAEAGLQYYRWFLAHNPGNLTNGTGSAGPYTYNVLDPESGSTIGSASISVVGNSQCGQIQSIDLTSVGSSNADPGFPRTLFARYMQQSSAAYSTILNTYVWAGSSLVVTGPYFSNYGIRMDATNNSNVSSAVSTWDCNSSYGCSPEQTQAPGVVGSGSGSALWSYPVTPISFTTMQANLSTLKTYAQNNGGLYFAQLTSQSASQRGYHLIFNGDNTVTVKKVTATTGVISYSYDTNDLSRYYNSTFEGWTWNGNGPYASDYNIISSETLLGTYTIPSSCSLIFVNDRAWVEGVVSGKVTVVVAAPSQSLSQNVPVSAYLPNNITYATNDGTSGLTLIAQDDVLIPLNAPNNQTIHGIFVAQGGLFGRNFYTSDSTDYPGYTVPSSYSSDTLLNSLTLEGTIVSNLRTGTAWSNGSGTTVSGFQNRVYSYDELQATNPPPFTPAASTDYGFVLWKEE